MIELRWVNRPIEIDERGHVARDNKGGRVLQYRQRSDYEYACDGGDKVAWTEWTDVPVAKEERK
jgi:hypothetical protein